VIPIELEYENPNCDGDHCDGSAEVRVLPVGREANAILCLGCYEHEMAFRREANFKVGKALFATPAWPQGVWGVAPGRGWAVIATGKATARPWELRHEKGEQYV